jgi:hypothetical protein
MMNLNFDEKDWLLAEMQEEWNKVEDAFYKTHYDLARETKYDSQSWKKFLTHPMVADFIQSEMILIQQAKYRGLLKDLDSNARSTGLPQLLNALAGQVEKTNKSDEGPIFIYMHVPLNEQEEHAPNAFTADSDAIKDLSKF